MRLLTDKQFQDQILALMSEADQMADAMANDGLLGPSRTIKGLQQAVKAVWSRFAPVVVRDEESASHLESVPVEEGTSEARESAAE